MSLDGERLDLESKQSRRSIVAAVIRREWQVATRHVSDLLNPLLFLVLVIILFPLGVGPEPQLLARIAPGVIWVAAILSSLLGLERLFKEDFHDGTLEQSLLLPIATEWLVLAKVSMHWLTTAVPLLILSPIFAMLLQLPIQAWGALWLSLLLGTPVLSCVGAIGMALTVSINRSGALLSLLLLPLLIPLLIFATAAVEAAVAGLPASGPLALMAAITILTLVLSPFAVHAALRVSVN